MGLELWAQMAIESLVEDEALRGDLTDTGYQPLLDWAIARATQCTQKVAEKEDPRPALESCVARLRLILRAASEAAEQCDATLLSAALGPPVLDRAEVHAVLGQLAQLSLTQGPDENARQIAHALSAVGHP